MLYNPIFSSCAGQVLHTFSLPLLLLVQPDKCPFSSTQNDAKPRDASLNRICVPFAPLATNILAGFNLVEHLAAESDPREDPPVVTAGGKSQTQKCY